MRIYPKPQSKPYPKNLYLGHIKGIFLKCQISLDKFDVICSISNTEGKKMRKFNCFFFYFYFDTGHP